MSKASPLIKGQSPSRTTEEYASTSLSPLSVTVDAHFNSKLLTSKTDGITFPWKTSPLRGSPLSKTCKSEASSCYITHLLTNIASLLLSTFTIVLS